mmetsp:Transcript_8589/g.14547  ORF Transcript_8589/g.14547 Transcript_8589/m.14547 type:complete len:243 (+) Transcript_8589:1457-2185(+)
MSESSIFPPPFPSPLPPLPADVSDSLLDADSNPNPPSAGTESSDSGADSFNATRRLSLNTRGYELPLSMRLSFTVLSTLDTTAGGSKESERPGAISLGAFSSSGIALTIAETFGDNFKVIAIGVEPGLDDDGLVAVEELELVPVFIAYEPELIPGAIRRALWGLMSQDGASAIGGVAPIIIGDGKGKGLLPAFGTFIDFLRDLSLLSLLLLVTTFSVLLFSSSSSTEMLSTVVCFMWWSNSS